MTDSLIETENNFTNTIKDWYNRHKRDLPWRKKKDPYRVWLSEIILQQTRVAQGLPYYLNFIEKYPTVFDLASAPEQDVMKTWEGLGYYSRARNLLAAAKTVVNTHNGKFPDNYKDLLTLRGVGPYTAAAVASICFDEAVPVIDGNVFRVISRVFGVDHDIALASSRKVFEKILNELIPQDNPGDFNQGLMEMGALVCTPGMPDCPSCELREFCFAFKHGSQTSLPVKKKKTRVRQRTFHYYVWEHQGKLAMKKRNSGDVWEGLYDFHLEEDDDLIANEPHEHYNTTGQKTLEHVLSHQKIKATFYHQKVDDPAFFNEILEKYQLSAFSPDEVLNLPKPKLIVNYLNRVNF